MPKETEETALEQFVKHVAEPFAAGKAKVDELYVLRDAMLKEYLGVRRTKAAKAAKVCGCTQAGPTGVAS